MDLLRLALDLLLFWGGGFVDHIGGRFSACACGERQNRFSRMIRTIFFRFYVSLVGLSFLGRFLCIVLVIVVAFLVVQCYRLFGGHR